MAKSPNKRQQIRFVWPVALESILLGTWRDNIINLRKSKHNGHIYNSMAEYIKNVSGTLVTVKEMTAKIKNLTRRYREEKSKIGVSGGSPSLWSLYERIHQILGPFPSHNLIVEESIVPTLSTSSATPEDIFTPSSPLPEVIIEECEEVMTVPSRFPSLSTSTPSASSNRNRKRSVQCLLLEEFKRTNSRSEEIGKQSNELLRTANSLLDKSLKLQEGLLKRLTLKKPAREIPIDELKKQNKQLQTQLQNLKKNMRSYEQMEKSLSNVFTKGQLEKLKKCKKKKFKWTLDDLLSASCLRSTDHQAYKYLQKKKIPFPRPLALKRWAMKIEHHPGMLRDFIASMEMWKLSDEEKVCMLCFDKIRIKSKSEKDNEKGDLLNPTKYVQVVMARGLFKEWKQPVFYAFDCKMSKSILETIISELYKTRFNVVALVSNISPSTQRLWKELQIGLMKTWFYHPDDAKQRIFVFADAPYLLKMMRDHFIDTGFIIKGKLLNSAPLKKLLASMTRPESEAKSAHDITECHLNVKKASNSRRKVKRATQLFSNTLSSSLKRCTQLEKRKCSYAIKVGNFVKLVNDWIDVLNSNESAVGSCTSVKAFGLALDAQKKILNEMDDAVLHLRIPNQSSLSPFQKGILISNCSLRGIFKFLQMNYSTRCIFAGRLNQDELENFFETVRVNDKRPTRLEFQYRLWSNFLSRSLT